MVFKVPKNCSDRLTELEQFAGKEFRMISCPLFSGTCRECVQARCVFRDKKFEIEWWDSSECYAYRLDGEFFEPEAGDTFEFDKMEEHIEKMKAYGTPSK